jgi:hypothetical protein
VSSPEAAALLLSLGEAPFRYIRRRKRQVRAVPRDLLTRYRFIACHFEWEGSTATMPTSIEISRQRYPPRSSRSTRQAIG